MNTIIAKALFLDALYQVLDNRVFRLLAVLVLLLVLPTFLIGAREESLVILFGWREYFYEDIFGYFNLPYPGRAEAACKLIGMLQQVFVDFFAGTLGIMFCIAATAFFVPRMLEKGAADALFTKPVGRFTLLMARYAAGLIFVSLLATLLVGGIHVGLLLNSGYSDSGFLWSIPTLIYLFALLHGVSLLVGVITRSTVAAILTTMMFFVFTGCVHQVWEVKEREQAERSELIELRNRKAEGADVFDRVAYYAGIAVDLAHFTLPKTNDASLIAKRLRQRLSDEGPELYDSEADLTVIIAPEGFERESDDLTGTGALWLDASRDASVRLKRRPYQGEQDLEGRYGRDWRHVLVDSGVDPLLASLRADPQVEELLLTRSRRGSWTDDEAWQDSDRSVADRTTAALAWQRGQRAYETVFFGDYPQWLYSIESEAPLEVFTDPEFVRARRGFEASFQFNREHREEGPRSWYEKRFDWNAPLPFNIWFSILSSLAFALAVLGLAGWRLARIDF